MNAVRSRSATLLRTQLTEPARSRSRGGGSVCRESARRDRDAASPAGGFGRARKDGRDAASRFKVGSSLTFPVADADEAWDRSAAARSVFAASGLNTPWGDGYLARECLVYDAARI